MNILSILEILVFLIPVVSGIVFWFMTSRLNKTRSNTLLSPPLTREDKQKLLSELVEIYGNIPIKQRVGNGGVFLRNRIHKLFDELK